VIAHKFLRAGAVGLITKEAWPLPGVEAERGGWRELPDGPLVPCRRGLHACRVDQLAYWLSAELWQVELGEEWIETRHSLVARRLRLVRRVEAWQGAAGQAFAEACAVRAEQAFAGTAEPSKLAREYLEQTRQFARARLTSLTAYAGALVSSAVVEEAQAMHAFDVERRLQGRTLAGLAGLAADVAGSPL
jgi:hypothetical protein